VSPIVALLRLLPWAFFGRLIIAFTEITLAVFVVSSSIVVGHELKAWREWFWDPDTTRPWAPTPQPSPTMLVAQPIASSVQPAAASPQWLATPAAAAPMFAIPVTVGGAFCRPPAPNEQLVFINKVITGADCVRTVQRDDGIHVVVETYPGTSADFGVIASSGETPNVRVFVPINWTSPVLVVQASRAGNIGAMVLTWEARSPTQLIGVSGQKVDLSTDSGGWPRLVVTSFDGSRRMYIWTGSAFSAQ
jgi:hypothetical protein